MAFEQLQYENRRLKQENALLRQQPEWFKRKVFGRTPGKFGQPGLSWPREAECEAPKEQEASPGSSAPAGAAAGATKAGRRTRKSRLPENLPVF